MSESNLQKTQSPYTPTTEEVREYLTRVQGTGGSLARAQAEAIGLWFDCWLAEVKAQERMRIKEIINKETFHYGKTHYEGINCVVCRIYARIDNDK